MGRHLTARPGLLLLLYALWISGTMAKNTEFAPRYETAYACEGKTLKIECKDGELIKLIRANYGRFSITICNDHGNTDWSVNCMSPKSLRVLHNRCNQNQNCSIPASTSMFGEPCNGTLKYLEAHYQCIPAATTTTTNRPSPPWLITSQPPSVWSTVKPTARPPPPPPKVSVAPPSRPSTTTTVSTQATPPPQNVEVDLEDGPDETEKPPLVDVPPDEIATLAFTIVTSKKTTTDSSLPFNYVPSQSMNPPWTKDNDNTDYCSPNTARNLYWNWTRIGDINIQPCPGGTTGFAKWKCISADSEAQWSPQTPDLSECRSVWLTSLESRSLTDSSLVAITTDLSQVTSSKTLYGGDMMITTKIIKKVLQKMAKSVTSFSDPKQGEAVFTDLLQNVVKTGSNLLDPSQHPSWRDLNHKEQMRVATSLLIGLEENAFLLADTVIREKNVVQMDKNIMLSIRVLETRNIVSQIFPSDSKWIQVSNDTIELPRKALLENSEGGFVRLVFVAFDRLEEILEWQPELTAESSGAAGSQQNVTRILNSKVISASLGKGRHIQLSEPVRLTLKHIRLENVSNPSCVFWDYTTNTWSEEGCRVDSTNISHTICLCDHLTNFAILMDVHATYLPAAHEMALQIITYVGCIVSIICLVLAIITFQLFRGLKSDRTTIHSNLCVCLLIAELLFLVGINQTENIILCGVVAALLHYFFLCAFVWMFFEGFQLYVMLIEVFEAEKSRIRWYYLIAYGLPLVIVAISGAIDPFSYGTEQYCWLRADNYFIYSFVGPVIVVIGLNLFFLSMAIVLMCRHANATVSMKNKEHSRLASARTWLRGAIVLVFLLGLTWTFGLLYLNKESVTMAYIFAVLNSLQGFFIFVFHCVQNEKVRKEYRKFIRRHSWLPKCLRCSKPSGGAASSSGSSGGKERRTSLYAGSNGNPSAPNSHSTDNSVLSPHGTSNISFKSYSRDSGHGGSEQEDSPRSQAVTGAPDNRLNNQPKDTRRQPYISEYQHQQQQDDFQDYIHRGDVIPHPKHLQLPQSLQPHGVGHPGGRKKNGSFLRSASPWNHTYTEIHEAQIRIHHRGTTEDDPVYEEIERNEIQVSDMSDEDGRRQSDMSRQSSRSYGDHRPLIPYSPAADRNIHSCLEAVTKHRNKEHGRYVSDVDPYRMSRQNMYRGDTARSLAAVLDGETVVCHLEPPEMYLHDPYNSRTMVLPQYSES